MSFDKTKSKDKSAKKLKRLHAHKLIREILKLTPRDGSFHSSTEVARIIGADDAGYSTRKCFALLEDILGFNLRVEISHGTKKQLFIRVGGESGNDRSFELQKKAKAIVTEVAEMLEEQ